jgi:hypothetical protein
MHICFTYLVLEQLKNKTIHCTVVGDRVYGRNHLLASVFDSADRRGISCRLDTSKGWKDLCRYAVEPSRSSLYYGAIIDKLFSGAHVISRGICRRRPGGDSLVFAA